jgi:muramidase (phage lysozyme)
MSAQIKAFLAMLAISEGVAGLGDDGYNVIVGSSARMPILFGSYADHPRLRVEVQKDLVSTAAGRYQILARYFDAYRARLALKDFSPASQDAIATQMIRERNALVDIEAGHFEIAVGKVANLWASLPGNNYGQHQNQVAALADAFTKAGGKIL